MNSKNYQEMDSSRMRTTRYLLYRESLSEGLCSGGLCPGGFCLRGVSVQGVSLRGVFVTDIAESNMGPETETPRRNMGSGSLRRSGIMQRPLWTEWHTRVKTLPCPKLRLRAVTMQKVAPKQSGLFLQNDKNTCRWTYHSWSCKWLGWWLSWGNTSSARPVESRSRWVDYIELQRIWN